MDLSQAPTLKPRVALLIDGENVSSAVADQIILKASGFGDLTIRRVYGNMAKLGAWTNSHGIRPIHSGTGKNATDLLMTVEAMSFLNDAQADVLVLASSDRDFVHLVTHLRERSVRVVGIGESKTPEGFRRSCSTFLEIKAEVLEDATTVASDAPAQSGLDEMIRQLVSEEGEDGAFHIGRLGGRMHARYKIRICDLNEKSWRAYLSARPDLYDCDPRGPEARVHLKT